VAVAQTPYFRLIPGAPQLLHRFNGHKQIVDGLYQQDVLFGNDRPGFR
jgi:hypothetical protein